MRRMIIFALVIQFMCCLIAICELLQASIYTVQLLYRDEFGQTQIATASCEDGKGPFPRANKPRMCIHPTKAPTTDPITTTQPSRPHSGCLLLKYIYICLNANTIFLLTFLMWFQIVLYPWGSGCLLVSQEYLPQPVRRWEAVWILLILLVTIHWTVKSFFLELRLLP